MEPHGKSPKNFTIAVIPARAASVRLPGKLLREIAGKPLILHTLERARAAKAVNRVIVATDDEKIFRTVEDSGGEAQMTSSEHRSGSDRIAEVAEGLDRECVIVNVQGDEPLISPDTIDLAVNALIEDASCDIATASEEFTDPQEIFDPNAVKVVVDEKGYALYFTRAAVPFARNAAIEHDGNLENAVAARPELSKVYRKHAGIYVYRREFVLEFASWQPTALEKIEMLEQLRALEHGARIRVVNSASPSIGVDTEEDLERVRRLIST